MKNIILKLQELINPIVNKVGDKFLHFICSFLITIIIGIFNPIMGIIVGCVIGLLKEIYDQFRYTQYNNGIGFSCSDLIYDVIGIAFATIIIYIV